MTDSPAHIKEPEQERVKAVKKPKPPKPVLPKRLYTEEEAASYLGRTLWGMRELRYAGKIEFIPGSSHSGSRKYYDVHDLDAYIDENKTRRTF